LIVIYTPYRIARSLSYPTNQQWSESVKYWLCCSYCNRRGSDQFKCQDPLVPRLCRHHCMSIEQQTNRAKKYCCFWHIRLSPNHRAVSSHGRCDINVHQGYSR